MVATCVPDKERTNKRTKERADETTEATRKDCLSYGNHHGYRRKSAGGRDGESVSQGAAAILDGDRRQVYKNRFSGKTDPQ